MAVVVIDVTGMAVVVMAVVVSGVTGVTRTKLGGRRDGRDVIGVTGMARTVLGGRSDGMAFMMVVVVVVVMGVMSMARTSTSWGEGRWLR